MNPDQLVLLVKPGRPGFKERQGRKDLRGSPVRLAKPDHEDQPEQTAHRAPLAQPDFRGHLATLAPRDLPETMDSTELQVNVDRMGSKDHPEIWDRWVQPVNAAPKGRQGPQE